jgi:hypothetical protein
MVVNHTDQPIAVQGAARRSATATIIGGDATGLSGAVELGAARLARITMPQSWTPADLTFAVSDDGEVFADLYDADGAEYSIKAAASRSIILPLSDPLSAQFIKVRSGTAGAPIQQGADAALTLVLVP